MPREPYPSQIAPKPKKMPKRIGDDLKIPKPVYEFENRKWKKTASAKTMGPKMPKPAREVAMGVMGSTEVQAKARQKQALDDMRKRGMLRKKQG